MILPEIEQEQTILAGVPSEVMRGSAFIFVLVTGFGKLPEHLTEVAAEQSNQLEDNEEQTEKEG